MTHEEQPATRQEQLIQLHNLSLQESALKQQITVLNREQDDLTRSLWHHLPQEQWIWVSNEMIAYAKHLDYVKGDNVDRGAITFKDLKRVDDKV